MVQIVKVNKISLLSLVFVGLSGCVASTGGYTPPVEDRSSGMVQPAEPVKGVVVAPRVTREKPLNGATSIPTPTSPVVGQASNPAVLALLENASRQKRNGQVQAAQSSLSRAQRIAPRDPEVYYQLADLNRLQGSWGPAEQLALKGTNMAIGDSIMLRRLWLLIADIREQSGQHSAARKARQQAMMY